MPTLTAWCYQTPLGARVGETRLRRLQDAGALEVHCAIVVTWARGAHRPRAAHVRHRVHPELDDPPMLIVLAGAILGVSTSDSPSAAAAVAARRLRGTGIGRAFLLDASTHFAPGCSVLLVVSGRADLEVVLPVVQRGLSAGEVEVVRAEVPDRAVGRIGELLEAPDTGDGVHPNRGRSVPDAPT